MAEPTPQRIHELTWAFTAPLILETAIDLKLFDRLADRCRFYESATAASAVGIPAHSGDKAQMNSRPYSAVFSWRKPSNR